MPRKPYSGTTRKLLLAFDLGTTFSGISYSVMDPGQVPEIRPVTRYPGQGHVGADCKIPTEIYYDAGGNIRAIGAEASTEGIDSTAEDEGWTKAKWFKMHMRPRGQRSNVFSPTIPPLPPNKTLVRVFADYLEYLLKCARVYIQETHATGTSLWESLAPNIVYVLTHPNGWEGPQQSQMREAAILAGLITNDTDGKARITFVTEGEASLHFCINNGLAPDALKKRDGIIIVDAGGGTIDISAYRGQDEAFHETAIPQCHFQGSIFVTTRAEEHFASHLRGTRFQDDVPRIVELFDKRAKLTFRDDTTPQFVRFGPTRESEPSLGIRNGQIKLSGPTVATFFKPSISCVVKAVKEQVAASSHPTKHIFLVGGFAASDWLFKGVKDALQRDGLEVSRPDSHVNKAVSDGAAAFYLDHIVESRISRACFGITASLPYNAGNPEHARRKGFVQPHPFTKVPSFPQSFSLILPKNEQVRESKEYRKSYIKYHETLENIYDSSTPILCYKGKRADPIWMHEETDGIEFGYTVTPAGWRYTCEFDIILLFGLTELKAQVAWTDESVSRDDNDVAPALMIYPGQGHVGADCKIPTEIYYNSGGKVCAIGAEASTEGIDGTAEDEGWTKVVWFKMHMRPRGQGSNFSSPAIPPLPPNKTLVRVFADFLEYLFECARAYIQETHAGGVSLWESVVSNIDYVLTHPNGWGGPQQSQMREAAILAGLITNDANGKSRITFVTEGEASLHFCINNGLAPDALEKGDGIIIVDAGGGTIDISAYRGQDGAFQETAIPQCHFQGSIYVTNRAKAHLQGHLRGTRFEEDVPHIVRSFDKGAKLTFRDDATAHFVRFGPSRESDASLNIRNGQIKFSGPTVATFFKPSITCIVKAVKEQVAASHHPAKHIFLVGGLAASDWLFQGVKDALKQDGLEVSRPDSHVNKAVADGAAAFFLDHFVKARISRACFGTIVSVIYDASDPEHVRRKMFVQPHPSTRVATFPGSFSLILPKNEQVQESKEYRESYVTYRETREELYDHLTPILCYKGECANPIWIREEMNSYLTVGQVHASLNGVAVRHIETPAGWRYTCHFDVILLFGLTELKAQIAWTDDLGVERRGAAEVIFEPN
ncbi:hypothetical protein BKA70DRAFT_1205726 [Coprinopsis sp. MPI-PUGE-AT-0042]|nr:hypothetical protein BKA70DRAFT_1205726 [Coprinopsis sp. MPI-PUGE-AT-0042]